MIRVSMGVSMGDSTVSTTTKISWARWSVRSSRGQGNSLGMVRVTQVREVDFDESYTEGETTQKSVSMAIDDPITSIHSITTTNTNIAKIDQV